MSETPKITPDLAVTWLSGHMGWHNGYRVMQTAITYGWTVPEEWREDWDAFLESCQSEHGPDRDLWDDIHGDDGDIVDKATEYLEERAPDGFTFVWDMGELSMMSMADAEEFGHFG